MIVFRVGSLPDDPLAASAAFHAEMLPQILSLIADSRDPVALIFAPAPHPHLDWRRAIVASLARERAPLRINALACDGDEALQAALRYLDAAPAITGHYLTLDGAGAGPVLD